MDKKLTWKIALIIVLVVAAALKLSNKKGHLFITSALLGFSVRSFSYKALVEHRIGDFDETCDVCTH